MTDAPIILIADRNEDVLDCFREEPVAADCALFHAKDGQEALSIVQNRASPIAVAVIELELPVVNGFDVIGRLTSLLPKPKKIIATTFLDYEPLHEPAKHMVADAIVRKPIPKETLRQLLPEYLDNGPVGT